LKLKCDCTLVTLSFCSISQITKIQIAATKIVSRFRCSAAELISLSRDIFKADRIFSFFHSKQDQLATLATLSTLKITGRSTLGAKSSKSQTRDAIWWRITTIPNLFISAEFFFKNKNSPNEFFGIEQPQDVRIAAGRNFRNAAAFNLKKKMESAAN
jgi:hypothetical protein